MGAGGEADEADGGADAAEAKAEDGADGGAEGGAEAADGAEGGADGTDDDADDADGGANVAEGGAEEEEEEGQEKEGRQGGAELEAIRLMDMLHLGGYWPVEEGAAWRRRPPPRLGVEQEQERGFWEERLPRELSMGDPGSRQLTPHPSPPAPKPDLYDQPLDASLDTPDQLLDATDNALNDDAPNDDALEDALEYQHLPAWDCALFTTQLL